MSFCVDRAASSWPAVDAATHVGVHVLDHGQARLATTFATSGIDRFAAPTAWREGPHGVPLLDGVHAVLLCRVADRLPAGDHAIVLAEPLHGEFGPAASRPLVYHDGRYTRAA